MTRNMEEVAHIIDADAASLEERVTEALAHEGGELVVDRFTWWQTGRPPVHEALVLRRAA